MLLELTAINAKTNYEPATTRKNIDTASMSYALPINSPIIDGYLDINDHLATRQLCRDMYYHDPICGGAIDIYSSLPFGEFSLSGLPEKEMLFKFMSSIEAMRVKTLLPIMSVDYFVDGAATAALNYDSDRKIFDSYVPLNLDDVVLYPNPTFGQTPLMDVRFPDDARRIFSKKNDSRVEKMISNLPVVVKEAMTKGGILELNPENSVYIPRTSQSYKRNGISLLHRIIPYWLLEKALLRGTIMMAYRRQRGILIVQMGSDEWKATTREMEAHINEIMMADRDPQGAIIAMRPEINFQEIRDGGNFWKHSDTIDSYNSLKMKALGISESAYSGETAVGTAEAGMTIFNYQLRSTRENIIRTFLYEKVFPVMSRENNFAKEDKFIETSSHDDNESVMLSGRRLVHGKKGRFSATANNNDIAYYIPTVNFHNTLRPEASSDYMQMLDTLTQKGIPIPIRTLAAAAGISIGDLLAGQDEDLELRKAFNSYSKLVAKYSPKEQEGGNDFANTIMNNPLTPPSTRRKSILERAEQFSDTAEKFHFKQNGNRLTTKKGRDIIDERHNKVLARVAANIATKNSRTPQ